MVASPPKPKKITACPGWLALTHERTSFVLVPERVKVVRDVFELSISGLGGYSIAKLLNERQVPAFGPSGRWDQSTIHNMLSSRATIGEHQPSKYVNNKPHPIGKPIPGYYPAVVDEHMFDAAQRAREKNLAYGRGRKGRFVTNIFAGLPTCLYCGSPIEFRSNGPDKSLMCSRLLDGQACFRNAWTCKNLERSLFDFIHRCAQAPDNEMAEWESLCELRNHIEQLTGPNLYDARIALSVALRRRVEELKLASAGPSPTASRPDAKIKRDVPGRYFVIRFRGAARVHEGRGVSTTDCDGIRRQLVD
jgi:hypothetical protein